MTRIDLATSTLGQIAVALPGATAVFRRHKLDFCCGGAVTLDAAAAARSLDAAIIAAELTALDDAAPVAPAQGTPELIDRIITRYHDVHRRELPELIRLARRVEHVHAGKAGTPAGLAAALENLRGELESHMMKEEAILFPLLRAGQGELASAPVARMRAEHDDHGAELEVIDGITSGLTLPAEACNTFRALYAGLGKFIDDLMEHVHLENNVLFPRFETGTAPALA